MTDHQPLRGHRPYLFSQRGRSTMSEEWRDIAEAPKDGTRVRLLIPYEPTIFSEDDCTTVGEWDADAVFHGAPFDLPNERGCWRFDGEDGAFDIQPTHWKPLPQPPIKVRDQEE